MSGNVVEIENAHIKKAQDARGTGIFGGYIYLTASNRNRTNPTEATGNRVEIRNSIIDTSSVGGLYIGNVPNPGDKGSVISKKNSVLIDHSTLNLVHTHYSTDYGFFGGQDEGDQGMSSENTITVQNSHLNVDLDAKTSVSTYSTVTKPEFSLSHVQSLFDRGDLTEGSVITSAALTMDGCAFNLTTSDSSVALSDTGLKGILGASAVNVNGGKTLTLMGDQAVMAQALRATVGRATSVITDAPMTLTNGNLKLGIGALTATQGTLAPITADATSTVTTENGVYEITELTGSGLVSVKKHDTYTTQLTLGDMEVGGGKNESVLTVTGKSTLKCRLTNAEGAEMNLGAVTLVGGGDIVNMKGATLTLTSLEMNPMAVLISEGTLNAVDATFAGTVALLGTQNVTGTMTVADGGTTTLAGKSTIKTLSVGTSPAAHVLRDAGAGLDVTGDTYAEELDLVSGMVNIRSSATLAGETLKGGSIGAAVKVAPGATFAFSYNEAGLQSLLEDYKGETDGKAVWAVLQDLRFAEGGSLSVGTTMGTSTVNLGADALVLLGTTELHGQAILNGQGPQSLSVADGAELAFVDDLIWGNHYLVRGFDDESMKAAAELEILDKDGKAMEVHANDRGVYVTVGGTDIREKDAGYGLDKNFNVMLDGRQDKDSSTATWPSSRTPCSRAPASRPLAEWRASPTTQACSRKRSAWVLRCRTS